MTPTQLAALKAAIQADPALNFMFTEGNLGGLADALNAPATPAVYVWRSSVPSAELFDAITWSNFTPADAVDGTATYTNRALCCQGKQFNIQLLTMGRESISMGRANVRTGVKDALQNIPAGAAGALVDAGWAAVKTVSTRQASVVEKVFATGAGTLVTPSALVVEGPISYTELIGL